jgi:hypothetical protein
MKRFWIIATALLMVGFTLALAAEKPQAAPPISPPTRVPEMSTAGRVIEVSDTLLKIERTLKGEAETMEFVLEKPFPNLTVGNQIKVSYRAKEGRNILIRVAPAKMTAIQKPKKETPKSEKTPGSKAAPITK